MLFLKGGRHLWTHFSQSFSDKNEEFLCSSERKFPELFKTHPTFVYSPLLVPSTVVWTLIHLFFGTPCIFWTSFYWPSVKRKGRVWENNIRMSYSTSIVVVECTDRPSWVSSAEYLACAAWLCQHWLALPCPVHWSVATGHNPVLSKLTVRWQHMSQNKTWILLTWI